MAAPASSFSNGRTRRPRRLRSFSPRSAPTTSAIRSSNASCSPTISTTIAVEVPIWLHAEDIAAIERRWGIQLFPKAATAPSEGEARSITGHIDFLQIRNGAIHILDYKPDATTGKPFAQLTLYALALSHLTGIPLFDFKCAWFNERQYCEFFPRTVLARKSARSARFPHA